MNEKPMKKQGITREEVTNEVMEKFRNSVNKFLDDFSDRTAEENNFLTMDQIEDMYSELDMQMRSAFQKMISDSISSIDEKKIIQSKKADSPKEG